MDSGSGTGDEPVRNCIYRPGARRIRPSLVHSPGQGGALRDATLASAHVLWQQRYLGTGECARFFTKSGTLTAELNGDWIAMDFPEESDQPAPAPPGLADALGIRPWYVGKNRFDYVVETGSEREVRDIQPDFRRLAEVPARGIMVTAPVDPGDFDFVSRFFALLSVWMRILLPVRATAALVRSGKKGCAKTSSLRTRCLNGVVCSA